MKEKLVSMMVSTFGADWKTTLIGIVTGIGVILEQYMDKGETSVARIGLAICVFLLGKFSSDIKNG